VLLALISLSWIRCCVQSPFSGRLVAIGRCT